MAEFFFELVSPERLVFSGLVEHVVAPGTDGLAAVVAEFGAGVLAPDGSLDRRGLAALAFASDERRRALEAITHPRIAARTADYEGRFANPFVAAERGFIDEVIMPHSTRRRVARAFASLRNKKLSNPWKKHDNIPL